MSNMNRDIGTEDLKIEHFVEKLKNDKFLIPTFQRDFVWEPENIVKLWDSIYRFYPVGSILVLKPRPLGLGQNLRLGYGLGHLGPPKSEWKVYYL